jgi:hypothetical protein
MRAPVSLASSMSRWTISSSAIAGQPGRPSSLQQRPSCMTAPAVSRLPRSAGRDDVEPGEYSIARRISSGSWTAVAVVGEHPYARADELGERCQLLASPTDRDAPGRQHLAQPGGLALGAHELDEPRESWAGSVLGIATTAV